MIGLGPIFGWVASRLLHTILSVLRLKDFRGGH
jgi:hypothetical protein